MFRPLTGSHHNPHCPLKRTPGANAMVCVAAAVVLLSAAVATRAERVAPRDTGPSVAAGQSASNTGFGTLDPAPPAGITIAEITKRMGARESEFAAARNDYEFKESVKIDTISEDTGRPDGEYQQISNISFDKDGKREEHVTFAPQNTLERVILTTSDMEEIAHRLPFILTTEQLPEYDLTYLGRQKVDDLDTYVFDVKPKTLGKGKKYIQGKVWLDQQDLEIVLVNGITVPQDTRRGHEDLSPPFTTYYQQIDGKYWFPTYTKAEGTLHFTAQDGALSQDVHMRSIVRYTDYKRFRTSVRLIFDGTDITDNKAPGAAPTTPPGTSPSQEKTSPPGDPMAPPK